MSKELTEQWKAGELPQWRFYYVLYSGGIEPILLNGENDFNNHCRIINSLIKEVLAPVPRYEELQRLESDSLAKKEGEEIVAELNYKNKELLKQNKEQRQKIHILTESQMKLENTIGELGKQNAKL